MSLAWCVGDVTGQMNEFIKELQVLGHVMFGLNLPLPPLSQSGLNLQPIITVLCFLHQSWEAYPYSGRYEHQLIRVYCIICASAPLLPDKKLLYKNAKK